MYARMRVRAHKRRMNMIVIYLTCYLFRKLSCFFAFVVKAFGLIFLLISISFPFLFGHFVQAKRVSLVQLVQSRKFSIFFEIFY